MTLAELIQQSEFESPALESLLNVVVTASWMNGEMNAALSPHGITQAQYNVLRILRGRHPGCYTCSDMTRQRGIKRPGQKRDPRKKVSTI